MNRTSLLWMLAVVVVLVGGFFTWSRTAQAPPTTEFTFEVVDTEAAREQGLGGRDTIPSNYGMLFVFPQSGDYGFWMKDMLVSIDILWLDEDGTILGIEEAVSPLTYPDTFYPPKPVRYVLETKPEEARAQGWNIGSTVPIPR